MVINAIPNKKPAISIIIPAYNEEDYLAECLESLLNQDLGRENYEVIVVNNASTDNTARIAKKYTVKLVTEKKKGYIYALIAGVKEAKGEIFAFTDADCRVPRNWLSNFLEKFKSDPALDAIGGTFSFFDGNQFLKSLAEFSQPFVYHLTGGNMAIRRSSYHKFDGFNPKINYGADVALHFKVKKFGKLIIDRHNIVYTSARRYSHDFPRTMLLWTNDIALKLISRPIFTSFPDIR